MVSRLILELDISKLEFNQNMGSSFHGYLFNLMDTDYAEQLHKQNLKPYSMKFESSFKNGSKVFWIVNSLDKEFTEKVLNPLNDPSTSHISIYKKDIEIPILSKKFENRILIPEIQKSEKTLKTVRVKFQSPTAFKSSGEYVFLPTIRLVFQSLINKNNSFSDNLTLDLEYNLEQIEKYVRISSYNLNSTRFHLEGIRIPAFSGQITLNIFDSEVESVVDYLLAYGEFSGIGIKSTMGMGAIKRE